MSKALASTCLATLASLLLPKGADGHGFIVSPPMRGGISGNNGNAWCPQCGNGETTCGDGGQWGGSSDMLNLVGEPVVTWTPGQEVDIQVRLTAHHKGHFEFHICDKAIDGTVADRDECLMKYKLTRVPPASSCQPNDSDGNCQPLHEGYPERWYVPPATTTYTIKMKVPSDLQCSHCTLQWRWWTANSCIPAPDYGCYFDHMRSLGWDASTWCGNFCGTCSSSLAQTNVSQTSARGCGEEFRNCVDIAVLGATSPSPSPTSTPTPTTTTTQMLTPTPVPAPIPATTASTTKATTATMSTTARITTTTMASEANCLPLFDCSGMTWCDMTKFRSFCANLGESSCHSSTFCRLPSEPMAEPEPEPEPETEPETAASMLAVADAEEITSVEA
mmetsp:Transcript_56092/g.119421  ORF Transcript_56092/g.119421 Transcript_56092/m.119421 type:complete len:390 (-) Transcript_56092:687-1856(-)|eukprot:CAMPEP_0206448802 /NCGR_PEP_ID=MMETSP0324_2-20121206/17707_1 /ASSEMBLY_ACC=CAM_ASM_000836 /TAXON_ID=2866 /ORGANISM="Crypthecodinium cohnii, Strain Seligo" /LENGTH=389 /DNA_ID=CAMNT_0053918051 /DNA_START=127 /DNA_END=1296 /DNA_ORIENTATION=-